MEIPTVDPQRVHQQPIVLHSLHDQVLIDPLQASIGRHGPGLQQGTPLFFGRALPDPARLDALYAILDDRERHYFEHRIAV